MAVRHEVAELVVTARPTAVVVATTTWAEFPTLWRQLLDQVYRFLAEHPEVRQTGHNVMYYRGSDDRPTVEVGVEVAGPFPGDGNVVASELPAGRVAHTLHRGSYADLGQAHQAVIDWIRTGGRTREGPRWEIYGDWHSDERLLETEVFYPVSARPSVCS